MAIRDIVLLYHYYLCRLLSFGFFFPYPIMGISPSIFELLTVRPFPPLPTLIISGTQSGSIQLLTPAPTLPSTPLLTIPLNILASSRSRFPSASFLARIHSAWSSRNTSPSPGPVFADPCFGAGIEYFVPRRRYWKFGFKCTCITGASFAAPGAETVTVARRSEGFPQEGQNFFE